MKSSDPSSCSPIYTIIPLFFSILLSYFSYLEAFESLLQLPRSGPSEKRIGPSRVLLVSDFGAKGDGLNDDTEAFRSVWKLACSTSPWSKIVIKAGQIHLLKPIDFAGPCHGKVTLSILGTIVAPKDPDRWHGLDPRKWLYFHGVNHLTVEGGGTINGMGEEWWAQSCKVNASKACQHAPTAITFHRCKDLKVRGLQMVNSQQMHMAFTYCTRVEVSKLNVEAPAGSPNTDGIHISSSTKVVVTDSVIRTGDDCVSIGSNSSRILITDVTCGPGHGISIGSLGKWNSWTKVHDILIDGALLINTDNGLRIKTWQGGSGFATSIIFQNVLMENVSNPIIIDQYYCDWILPCLNQTSAVQVDNILFKHIEGTSATSEAMTFSCSDASPCKGLYLEDIQLVSHAGATKSFCWEAQGSSSGRVFPLLAFRTTEALLSRDTCPPRPILADDLQFSWWPKHDLLILFKKRRCKFIR